MKLHKVQSERSHRAGVAEVVGLEQEDSPKRFFDVERDFPPQDWGVVLRDMQSARERLNWPLFTSRAAQLVLLFPDRRDELGVPEGDIDVLKFHVAHHQELKYASEIAEQLVIFCPERRDEFRNRDGMKEFILQQAADARAQDSWNDFLSIAVRFKLLYPEALEELGLDDNLFQDVLASTEKNRSDNAYMDAAILFHYILILFPGRKHDLLITDKEETGMMEIYNRWHNNPSIGVWAVVLKVVAADRVEVDDKGVHFCYQEELKKAASLPVRKIA